MTDTDKELKDILTTTLEPKFQKFFNDGLMAGWDACIHNLQKQINGLTSAKAIKEFMKQKVEEANLRQGDKNAEG